MSCGDGDIGGPTRKVICTRCGEHITWHLRRGDDMSNYKCPSCYGKGTLRRMTKEEEDAMHRADAAGCLIVLAMLVVIVIASVFNGG